MTISRILLPLLVLPFLSLFAENGIYRGKTYQLDYSRSIRISILQKDGTFTPFLKGIGFESERSTGKGLFRSAGFHARLREKNGDTDKIEFEYRFSGSQSERIQLKGWMEAHPEWLRIHFNGEFREHKKQDGGMRMLIFYAGPEQRLLSSRADNGPEGGSCGIKAEFKPKLSLAFQRSRKSSEGTLFWKTENGKSCLSLDLALTPYCGSRPLFDIFSEQETDAALRFRRYCNILLEGDAPEAELLIRNRSSKPLDTHGELEITDAWNRRIEQRILPLRADAASISRQTLPLPVGRLGYFELTLRCGKREMFRTSYCILPSSERKYRKHSIFGGMLYPWNRVSEEKLDLLEWLGIGTVRLRGAYRILHDGTPQPSPGKNGIYSRRSTEEIFREYRKRNLSLIPQTSESWKYPPGTFQLTEAANEANATRLPADFAEELKIDYAKTKLHDPNLMVGGSGLAGVDTFWLEELQENGAWNAMDALFIHLHSFPRAPEVNNTMTREFWLHDRVVLLRSLMDRFGEKPVFDSENGYLTLHPERRVESYPLRSVSDRTMAAAFLVRAYLQALAYGLSCKMWFTIDGYGGFGLTEYEQPRPAFAAYAVMTSLLDGAEYAGELLSPGRISPVLDRDMEFRRSWFGQATPGLEKELLSADRESVETSVNPSLKPYTYIRAFRTPENQPILVCWATLYRQKVESAPVDTPAWKGQKPGVSLLWNGLPATRPPSPLPVRFHVGSDEVEIVDIMGNRKRVKTENGFLTLALDDMPRYVLGASPELLKEAERFRLQLFPKTFQVNRSWKPLIQLILPAEKRHPRRKSVFDKLNLSAELKTGVPYPVYVRLTNLDSRKTKGQIRLICPDGWKCIPAEVPFEINGKTEKKIAAAFKVIPDRPVEKAKIISITDSDRFGRIENSVMNVRVR